MKNNTKENLKLTLFLVVTFFVGVLGTIVVYKYYPGVEKEVVEKREVNITSNDSISESVDKIYDAVLVVETFKGNSLYSTGTGFVYKTDDNYGYIITNCHVVDGGSSVKVLDNNGNEIEATVLGSDEYVDIAVLRIDKKYVLQVAEIGSSSEAKLGDTVFTVGTPLGTEYQGTVTKGILSGKNRSVEVELNSGGTYVMEVLQTDAAINPGNSGGPLVNINGEVIGVNSLKLVEDEVEGMGFAIPIEFVMSAVEYLEQGKEIERPVFGVTIIDSNNIYALYQYGIKLDDNIEGIVVIEVEEGYPAQEIGLTKGDVITEVNGTKITDTADFRTELYKYNIGDEITIKYVRDGKEYQGKAKLTKSA